MKIILKPLKMGLLVSFVVATSLLTGCAGLMQHAGYEKIPKPLNYRCNHAEVLLTNLTLSPYKRHYLLPDGRLCPFNLPTPKPRTFSEWLHLQK